MSKKLQTRLDRELCLGNGVRLDIRGGVAAFGGTMQTNEQKALD